MKVIAPDYYTRFKCIAGECRHSCCIGWEIDIDEDTCARYRSVSGSFGRRLAESISWGETPCFRLGENERCPFLNEENLCDIIINLGEDALCQICGDHPRFRSCFESREEMGLGLCCEAAAGLIVNNTDTVKLITLEDDGGPDAPDNEAAFLSLRDGIIDTLQDRSLTIPQRTASVLSRLEVTMPNRSLSVWARIYASLERLDEKWGEMLDKLSGAGNPPCTLPDLVQEQLLVYMVWRHLSEGLYDGQLKERMAFCVLSVQMIGGLCAVCGLSAAEVARMYSAEIEYSDENIQKLLDVLGGE